MANVDADRHVVEGWWLRNKGMAGPLDTERATQQGDGNTASSLRNKQRLCLVAVRSMASRG